jgi:hypothetical protein
LIAGLIAISAAASAGEPVGVKVFVLRYKRVEEATLLVRPLLSDSGSILLQPKINAMTITDRPAALNTIGQALAQFDVPPRGFSIAVKMVRARADASAKDLSKEIGGIGNKLREVFRFNDYSLIDSAVLGGAEGESDRAGRAGLDAPPFVVRARARAHRRRPARRRAALPDDVERRTEPDARPRRLEGGGVEEGAAAHPPRAGESEAGGRPGDRGDRGRGETLVALEEAR